VERASCSGSVVGWMVESVVVVLIVCVCATVIRIVKCGRVTLCVERVFEFGKSEEGKVRKFGNFINESLVNGGGANEVVRVCKGGGDGQV